MIDHIQVVLDSLKAYNARDLELFKSFYDDSLTVRYTHTDKVFTKEEVFNFYETAFQTSPNANCIVVNIACAGNFVSVHEKFTGMVDSNGNETTPETIAVYKIHNEKIVELRHHFA